MRDDQENLTMQQRIQAFYQQSGGPGNPEIARILEEHLKFGKDHGIPGKKEDIRDAFTEVFLSDRSTKPIVMGLIKLKNSLKKEWDRFLDSQRPNTDEIIEKLKREKIGNETK